jgi:hypothetical protein
VPKYLYVLKMSQLPPGANVETIKGDIRVLFGTEQVREQGPLEFRVVSEFAPDMAQKGLRALTAKYGTLDFKGGSKIDCT